MALPPISRPPAPAQRPVTDTRAAAQRAFFEAALGRAATQPAPQATAPTAVPPRQPAAVAQVRASEPPTRPDPTARPGSIVNIRV